MNKYFCCYRLVLAICMACFVCSEVDAAYVKGDRHQDIKSAQEILRTKGYRVVAHGVLDTKTERALKEFQKKQHLKITGILDETTLRLIQGGENSIHNETLPLHQTIKRLLATAHKYQGVPYSFGGTTPKGFDCSGYVHYVFSSIGIDLPRSADTQYKVGKKIEKKYLQPGDLVFFETYAKGVSHSGIYVGNDQFISATTSRGVVVANLHDEYWGKRYIGAKRVI